MRFSPQTHSGDGIPKAETGSGDNVARAFQTQVARSNLFTRNDPESGLDLAEIEWQARAAQSAWIASNVKSFFAALVRRLRTESSFRDATTVLKGVEKKAA